MSNWLTAEPYVDVNLSGTLLLAALERLPQRFIWRNLITEERIANICRDQMRSSISACLKERFASGVCDRGLAHLAGQSYFNSLASTRMGLHMPVGTRFIGKCKSGASQGSKGGSARARSAFVLGFVLEQNRRPDFSKSYTEAGGFGSSKIGIRKTKMLPCLPYPLYPHVGQSLHYDVQPIVREDFERSFREWQHRFSYRTESKTARGDQFPS